MSKGGVEVTDWSAASRMDLDVTKDVFDAAPSGLADHVWGWFVGDRQLGIQTKETMLLNGTTLTVLGELTVSKDRHLRMQPPTDGLGYYIVKVRTTTNYTYSDLFLYSLKKTQVRKNSGFLKTQVFVNFQLTLLNKVSRKLRYFQKNSGIFRKTQVFDYIAELR